VRRLLRLALLGGDLLPAAFLAAPPPCSASRSLCWGANARHPPTPLFSQAPAPLPHFPCPSIPGPAATLSVPIYLRFHRLPTVLPPPTQPHPPPTHPHKRAPPSPCSVGGITGDGKVQLVAFCLFEVLVGVFWPSMMTMRRWGRGNGGGVGGGGEGHRDVC
jgi:hypothetical protein